MYVWQIEKLEKQVIKLIKKLYMMFSYKLKNHIAFKYYLYQKKGEINVEIGYAPLWEII